MNKWNKKLLITAVITTVAISLRAEVPKDTWGRVDIDGEKTKIKLSPVKKETKNVNLFNAKWRKDKQAFYLSGRIYFKKDIWHHAKLVFNPESSGRVKIAFLGAYNAKRDQEKWFEFTNIKIDGEQVVLNEKGWILKDGAEFITAKGPDGKDVKCVKAKCHRTASYKLSVTKDKSVTIEFDIKVLKVIN